MLIPVTMALLSGGTIVLARMLNADAGARIGIWPSTFFNYVTGFLMALVMIILFGSGFADPFSARWYFYLGGMVGVAVVSLTSTIASHLPAFLSTLLLFISQFYAGMIVDAVNGRATPPLKLIGAAVVTIGVLIDVLGDKKSTEA